MTHVAGWSFCFALSSAEVALALKTGGRAQYDLQIHFATELSVLTS